MYTLYSNLHQTDDMMQNKRLSRNRLTSTFRVGEDKRLQHDIDGLLSGGQAESPRQMSQRWQSSFAEPKQEMELADLVDGILNCGGEKKPPRQPSRTPTRQSASFQPIIHENLSVVVDDLLKENYQEKLSPGSQGVERSESLSSFTTAADFPTVKCQLTFDEESGFPTEISFPTADYQPLPYLQKSKVRIPDVFELEEERQKDDIVFVLADEEVASCSSSMEVVRKISSRLTSSCKPKHNSKHGNSISASKSRARPSLTRTPSRGMSMVGRPTRNGMHQLPFHMTRAEI